MRLLASGARETAEWALRVTAIALLAWQLALALRSQAPGALEVAHSAGLRAALVRWSTVVSPARVHAALDYPPTEVERDWLAALPEAGTATAWSGPDLVPTAIGVLPVADPAGGADIAIAAPAGASVVVGDSAGRTDTATAGASLLRWHLPRAAAVVRAGMGPVRASGVMTDSLERRRLLVLGSAGWETKFVIAALEERGWAVDAHIVVAPGADVAQGVVVATGRGPAAPAAVPAPAGAMAGARPLGVQTFRTAPAVPAAPSAASAARPALPPPLRRLASIDTSEYSAVVALDSTAAREAARVLRFVKSGGGLLLTAAAAESPGFGSVAPGRPGAVSGDDDAARAAPERIDALPARPLLDLKPDAVVLERRGDLVITAARRETLGRVVETGVLDLWRWRMGGDERGADDHRAWLARLVASVAYTARRPLEMVAADPAPLATLVDHLGPPQAAGSPVPVPDTDLQLPLVFAVLCATLLVEWLSRRLRSRP